MKILIIGSGFIGSHLATVFKNKGEDVAIFARRSHANPDFGVEWNYGDITDAAEVKTVVSKKFDVIINCSGYSGQTNTSLHPQLSYQVNVVGAINILEAVRRVAADTRVILIGSRLEYGQSLYLPVDESHPALPRSNYGKDKLEATHRAQEYFVQHGVQTTILRVSNVYGPHRSFEFNNFNVINYLLDQAYGGNDIHVFGTGKQKRDFLYIDDLSDAFVRVLNAKGTVGQIYNIGFGRPIAFVEMAQLIAQKAKVRVVHQPWPRDFLDVETGDYVSDIRKFENATGWKPRVSYEQGVYTSLAFLAGSRR